MGEGNTADQVSTLISLRQSLSNGNDYHDSEALRSSPPSTDLLMTVAQVKFLTNSLLQSREHLVVILGHDPTHEHASKLMDAIDTLIKAEEKATSLFIMNDFSHSLDWFTNALSLYV